MGKFGTTLFGYNKNAVDQYFTEMEKQSESMIEAKNRELEALRNSIEQSRNRLRMNEKELEDFSRQKEQIFSSFVNELAVIEQSVKDNREQMRKSNLAELNRLKQKINELEKWNTILHQFYNDISAIRAKYKISAE